MPMQAGKLRDLVTIQRLATTRDTTGAVPVAWAPWKTVWAHVEPYIDSARSGKEEYAQAQVQAQAYTRVHLRYLAGITPKDQVLYHAAGGDRVFDILAVNNRDERNAELELICKERQ